MTLFAVDFTYILDRSFRHYLSLGYSLIRLQSNETHPTLSSFYRKWSLQNQKKAYLLLVPTSVLYIVIDMCVFHIEIPDWILFKQVSMCSLKERDDLLDKTSYPMYRRYWKVIDNTESQCRLLSSIDAYNSLSLTHRL